MQMQTPVQVPAQTQAQMRAQTQKQAPLRVQMMCVRLQLQACMRAPRVLVPTQTPVPMQALAVGPRT